MIPPTTSAIHADPCSGPSATAIATAPSPTMAVAIAAAFEGFVLSFIRRRSTIRREHNAADRGFVLDAKSRYNAAVTTISGGFELRGRDGDETRLLVGEVGYSLAVPGHPRIITPRADEPRYDILMQLDDAPIEIGLRVDDIGSAAGDRAELATSLATTYAQSRAADPAKASAGHPGPRGLATGAEAAASATYQLRGDDEQAMEYLLLALRENAVLYLTVRFRRADVTVFGWGNLRSILLNHQSWRPGTLPSLHIWPPSPRFLLPSVNFDLTPAAADGARAKALAVGEMARDKVDRVAEFLLEAAANDMEPTTPWAPFITEHVKARVAMSAGSAVAEVLCRDLAAVDSTHDYRGWAWGCYWAVGNRPGASNA